MLNLKNLLEAHKFESVLKEKVDPIVCVTELVRCRTVTGKPFFAYISIKPSEYMEYHAKLQKGTPVDPNDYDIIEYGWGEEPPAHLRERMEMQYGVDHGYANKNNPEQVA